MRFLNEDFNENFHAKMDGLKLRPDLSGNPFLVAEVLEATKKDWERRAEIGAQIFKNRECFDRLSINSGRKLAPK